jgi:protocatechuate 3,4-dioxygenase beta subunit
MMRMQFMMVGLGLVMAACGQERSLIKEAEKELAGGKTPSQLLSADSYDSIRTQTAFRELVKQHAASSEITIVREREPGEKIKVTGQLTDARGRHLPHTLVYFYQTDSRGWYGSDRIHFEMMQGDRLHARLFGYLKTDSAGRFAINTIQPHGYPQSELPAHIHFEVFDTQGKALLITELLFNDDDRLTGERRSRSEAEGFLIAKPQTTKGKKIYHYTVIIH